MLRITLNELTTVSTARGRNQVMYWLLRPWKEAHQKGSSTWLKCLKLLVYTWRARHPIISYLTSWRSAIRMSRPSSQKVNFTILIHLVSSPWQLVTIVDLNLWLRRHFTLLKTRGILSIALTPWGKAGPCLWEYKDLLTPVSLCLPLISIQLCCHPLSESENTVFFTRAILSQLPLYYRLPKLWTLLFYHTLSDPL